MTAFEVLQPGSGPIRSTTYLPSTPDHLLWGRLPCARDEPVLSVEPGTEVTFDTVSHEGILEDQGRDPAVLRDYGVDAVLDDAVAIAGTGPAPVRRRRAARGEQAGPRPGGADRGRAGDDGGRDDAAGAVRRDLQPARKGGAAGRVPAQGRAFSVFVWSAPTWVRRVPLTAAPSGTSGSRWRPSSGSWASQWRAATGRTRCRPGRTAATSTSNARCGSHGVPARAGRRGDGLRRRPALRAGER